MSENTTSQYNNNLRAKLVEVLLEYIEEKRSFRSVLVVGITANHLPQSLQNPLVAQTVRELTLMGNHISNGQKFSKEEIKEQFTTLLELLTSKL